MIWLVGGIAAGVTAWAYIEGGEIEERERAERKLVNVKQSYTSSSRLILFVSSGLYVLRCANRPVKR